MGAGEFIWAPPAQCEVLSKPTASFVYCTSPLQTAGEEKYALTLCAILFLLCAAEEQGEDRRPFRTLGEDIVAPTPEVVETTGDMSRGEEEPGALFFFDLR